MAVNQNMIDEIRNGADIVEIVNSYIPLRKSGRNFKAICPFHHEKTPSFMVSSDKQIFHCFGCGEGGNVFNFVMKYERLDFREALEVVAKKIGFNIPQNKGVYKESSLVNKLFVLNELAAAFYHSALLENPKADAARRYLKERAVAAETIKQFSLGYSLPGWEDFRIFARKKGFSDELLEKSGLSIKTEQGKFYDRFRDKLMFPIANMQGKIVGFGSRTLEEKKEEPKYVNSPETEIYVKRKILYGFNLAKNHIAQADQAIITEGYFDVITPHQAGIRNIVGCLGTSFTTEQARILKRYTKSIVLVFDADSAGEAATLRGVDILIEEGLMVKIGCLPSGYDVDKLVKERGPEAFNQVIKSSEDLIDYKIGLLEKKYPIEMIERKARIAGEILPSIKKIENEILKITYIKRLSEKINVSEQTLIEELKKIKQTAAIFSGKEEVPRYHQTKISAAERLLLKLILEDNLIIGEVKRKLQSDDFEHPLTQGIASLLFSCDEKDRQNAVPAIIDEIEEEEKHFVSSLLAEEMVILDKKKTADDCIKQIKMKKLNTKLAQLESQLKYVESVKDEQKRKFLSMEFQRLLKEKTCLAK